MPLMFFSFLSRKVLQSTLISCVLTLSLLGAACGGRSEPRANSRAGSNGNTRRGGAAAAEGPAIEVTTAKAVTREVPSYIQASGSLIADETSDVSSQASGQVVATPVGVGAFVRQGTV